MAGRRISEGRASSEGACGKACPLYLMAKLWPRLPSLYVNESLFQLICRRTLRSRWLWSVNTFLRRGRSALTLLYPGPADQSVVSLIITQHPTPPREIWPLRVPVQRGFFQPVIHPPLQGYLIRGVWARDVNSLSDQVTKEYWAEEASIGLTFLRREDVITVLGQPAHAFPEQELIAVALYILSPEFRSPLQGAERGHNVSPTVER